MKVLFLCTANSCRSIFAEAICNYLAKGKVKAFSAGIAPSGKVHPKTLEKLTKHGMEVANLSSKSIEFHSNLFPDIVITVCDSAAKEGCPIWLGKAIKAHWGLPDPAQSSEELKDTAFDNTFKILHKRIQSFLSLPIETLSPKDLELHLTEIGRLQ